MVNQTAIEVAQNKKLEELNQADYARINLSNKCGISDAKKSIDRIDGPFEWEKSTQGSKNSSKLNI
jgi:hypothetical protein